MRWIEREERVRFNEVDEWEMAWHGHYVAWFEAGRFSLLEHFYLLPRQMVELGYIAPVINLTCEYKHPAACGDVIIIRTGAIKPDIAALICKFEILLKDRGKLLARGETRQVLLTKDRIMIYQLTGELEKRITAMVEYCAGE